MMYKKALSNTTLIVVGLVLALIVFSSLGWGFGKAFKTTAKATNTVANILDQGNLCASAGRIAVNSANDRDGDNLLDEDCDICLGGTIDTDGDGLQNGCDDDDNTPMTSEEKKNADFAAICGEKGGEWLERSKRCKLSNYNTRT